MFVNLFTTQAWLLLIKYSCVFAQLNRNKGKKMQYKFIKTTVIASALSFASLLNVAHAGLISGNYIHNDNSVGVAVVYDTDSQLTWLQNALSYDVDGKGEKIDGVLSHHGRKR